jgi:hypothetical protein
MPRMQTTLNALNTRMAHGPIREFSRTHRDLFAPGEDFSHALAHSADIPALYDAFKEHLANIPGGISEAMRAAIHYALGTNPPTLVTLAWAPSYDFEIDIWQAPDTEETRGGITILLKSRYPDDAHPIAKK